MGKRFLIDSNTIIDYTSNLLKDKASDFVEKIFNADFNISVIVKIEILGFDEIEEKLEALEEFLSTAKVLPLDDAVTKKTIELRRIKKLKLGDAIIAATALINDLVIVTRNTKDFNNIPNLKTLNLWEL
jgi:predicted nucleic acid-binding protein